MKAYESNRAQQKGKEVLSRSFLNRKRVQTYGGLTLIFLLVVAGLKLLFPPVPAGALVTENRPLIPTESEVQPVEQGKKGEVEAPVAQKSSVPQVIVPEKAPMEISPLAGGGDKPAVILSPKQTQVNEKSSRKLLELSTFNEGVDALESGNDPEAVAAFHRTLSINPLNVRACNNLGLALMSMGKHEAAEDAFQKGLVLEPGNTRCLNNLALLFVKSGDPARAVPFLEQIVKDHPTDAAAWTNLGVAERRIGKEAAAETAYRRALKLTPGDYRVYFNLARTLEVEGRLVEAAYDYRVYLRFLPPAEISRARKVIAHLKQLQPSLTVSSGRQ